jgi:hypothetical protein
MHVGLTPNLHEYERKSREGRRNLPRRGQARLQMKRIYIYDNETHTPDGIVVNVRT